MVWNTPAFVGFVQFQVIVRPVLLFEDDIPGAPGIGGAFVVPEQSGPQSDHPAVFCSLALGRYVVLGLIVRLAGDWSVQVLLIVCIAPVP